MKRFINLTLSGKQNIIRTMISEAKNPEDFSKNYFNYLKVLIDQLAIDAVGNRAWRHCDGDPPAENTLTPKRGRGK